MALQVEVTKIRVNESCTKAELKCKSSCTGDVSYVWLKNGEKVTEENPHITSLRFNDSICCALKGQEDYCSASLYAPKLPSVTVSPSGEIVENISVILICSSDANPAANYTWYKEDAPKLPSVSVSPSAEIVEGSSVTLTCSSDANPAANYTWYKEELFLTWPRVGVHHFPSISSENRGNYSCKSENQYGQINSSRVFINVQYAPKLPSVSVTPSGEIAEGSSVTLTCSSDANPAANYTWYKENKALPLGPEGSHHFPSISSEDRGNYFCKSENQYGQINSSYVFINVQLTPSGEIAEGSSVTLTCSSDANPAANYTWYKEKEDSPKAHGQTFTIDKFSPAHSGAYQCKVQNNRGHHSLTFLLAAKQPVEQKCSLQYASIQFSKKQTDPLYSNINPAQAQKHKKEEEEENKIHYATVKFASASRAPR
nr:PREDICTED: B-cell receptor CD22-like [Pundamilia nyererei]